MAEPPRRDPMITPSALAEALSGPRRPLVFDATWTMPAMPQPRAEGAIAGAIAFDIDALSDSTTPLPHMLGAGLTLSAFLRGLGATADTPAVVYDRIGVFSAPRAWWMLRALGLEEVRVLDGGLPAWAAAGLPMQAEPAAMAAQPVADRSASLVLRTEIIAGTTRLHARLGDPAVEILDARSSGRFRGEAPEPRPGVRSGRIPGSRNIPYPSLLTEDQTLKSPDALRAVFDAADIDLAAPALVTSCGSGVTAAIIALALARLGRWDVAVYDGSWAEWGADPSLPLETGAP